MEWLPSTGSEAADREGDHHQQHQRSLHLSNGDSSSSKSSIVKEFRQSSELLRNILVSLSSRRSSDSGSSNKMSSNPYLSVNGIEAADLQAALQTHRERNWMNPEIELVSESSPLGCQFSSADLFDAVTRGDVNRTRLILQSGMDPNVCNASGFTVLHWCTVQTPIPWLLIIELLEFGSRVEITDRDGTQPVFLLPSLPRIQHQLVKDSFSFLQRSFVETIPELGQQQCQSSRDPAGRATANIFRRFQQSTTRKPPVAKLKSKDLDASEASNAFDMVPFKVLTLFIVSPNFHQAYIWKTSQIVFLAC